MIRASTLAIALGALSATLMLGALGFQYLGGYPPCEMCHWQRWPHIGAIVVGLGGGALSRAGLLGKAAPVPIAWLTVLLVAAAGALGVYHAGVEWHWWPGPQHCTGSAFRFSGGKLNLNAPVVMCDVAAWRLFGLSLAGYNAIVSLVAAGTAAALLMQKGETK